LLRRFAPRNDVVGVYSANLDRSEGVRQVIAMRFEILGEISGIETFASGSGIREIARLRRIYGRGRKEFKIKHLL
jgi:hypothetical protein